MTPQEAIQKGAKSNADAQRALQQHQLAMQAFNIACARFEWTKAEEEQRLALDYLDAYMNAIASCHKLAQEMDK
jgi:hypothetical protein